MADERSKEDENQGQESDLAGTEPEDGQELVLAGDEGQDLPALGGGGPTLNGDEPTLNLDLSTEDIELVTASQDGVRPPVPFDGPRPSDALDALSDVTLPGEEGEGEEESEPALPEPAPIEEPAAPPEKRSSWLSSVMKQLDEADSESGSLSLSSVEGGGETAEEPENGGLPDLSDVADVSDLAEFSDVELEEAEPPAAPPPAPIPRAETPGPPAADEETASPTEGPEPSGGVPGAEPTESGEAAAPAETALPEEPLEEGPAVTPAVILEQALAQAAANSPRRLEVALNLELEAEEDRRLKAVIEYEIGHLLETRLDSEAGAVKAYALALNLDPTLRPNVWAIRRVFVARGLWANLLKLLEAEIRFEDTPRRRAELLLEKGYLQHDKIGDVQSAKESFKAAHEERPDWLAPLLALEKLALAQGDLRGLADIYRGMVEATSDPARRVALLTELARLQEKLGDGSPQQALSILEEAAALGHDRASVLDQMEQVALAAGLYPELIDVLRREAEDLRQRGKPDLGAAAAKLRSAAMFARDQLHDMERAQELLSSALEILPGDIVLQHDLLDLAEEREDWRLAESVLVGWLEKTTEPVDRAVLWHRIGLARAAAHAPDAFDAVDHALQEAPGFLPALAERERRCLADGDLEALVTLWTEEAQAVEARSSALPLAEKGDPRWCATALWRAALVQHRRLRQPEPATELCRRALKQLPGFGPAREELEGLLRETGQHAELASLIEDQLAAEGLSEAERAQRLESLALLYGGPLADPERQLDCLRRLAEMGEPDRRALHRVAELLARLDRHEELETTLRKLERLESDERWVISWRLTRAELYQRSLQRPDDAVALYWDILDRDPQNVFAFTALEGLLRRRGMDEELAKLLRRAADQAPDSSDDGASRVDYLRILGGVLERRLGRPADAVAVYSEILGLTPGDRPALQDLARAARAARDSAKLAEAIEAQGAAGTDDASRARHLLRFSEVLEDLLAEPLRSEEMLGKAIALLPSRATAPDALEALVRQQMARGDYAEAVKGLEELQQQSPPEVASLLVEERAWITAGPLGETEAGKDLWCQLATERPDHRGALWAKARLAARDRDPAGLSDAVAQLAALATDGRVATVLDVRAGTLADAGGDAGAAANAYRRALEREPGAIEAALGLLASHDLPVAERAELSRRLAESASDKVREDLRLPLAELYERAGWFAEALVELDGILKRDPDHLPALIVAQRVTQAVGAREEEARCWVRLAKNFSDRTAKSECFARGGELLCALSRPADAAVLFRQVLALKPSDTGAYGRLRELYTEAEDAQGLDQILAHRIHHTDDAGALISLYAERAELRLEKLHNRQGAVQDLLRILRLQPKHLEALRQLSHLYDEDGNVSRALEFYSRYVDCADSAQLKRPAVLRQAELLSQKLGRTSEAVEVCRRFLSLSPHDERVIELLAECYVQLRDYPHAVSTLERLGELREDKPWKAQVLLRIGNCYWKDMKDLSEARTTLMRARDLDPTHNEIVGGLRQLCRQMNLQSDVELLLERAGYDLREALAAQPLSLDLYRKLMQVAEWEEDEYGLLAAMGVLSCMNSAERDDRELYRRRMSKLVFEPKQQLAAKAWRDALMETGAKNACADIWAAVADCLPKLFEKRIPGDPSFWGIGRTEKVDRRAGGPVSSALDRIAVAFGIGDFDIYLSSKDTELVAGIAGEKPALVVGHSVVIAMDAGRRFQIGRALSLLRDRAFAVEILTRSELELLMAATIFLVEPVPAFSLPAAQVEAESRRVGKALSRRARRMLPLAVTRFRQEGADLESWVDGVIGTANRAGLLVCGDIQAAIDQLATELGGPSGREGKTPAQIAEVLGKNAHAARLLTYSVSKEYLNLRRELQL